MNKKRRSKRNKNENTIKKVSIYQVIAEIDQGNLLFKSYDQFKKKGFAKPPAKIYETVYSGDVKAKNLSDIFRIFNTAFPSDYTGRSLTTSDVIEIKHNPSYSEYYFCDMVGFKKVEFEKKAASMKIINHTNDIVDTTETGLMTVFFIKELGVSKVVCDAVRLKNCRYSQCQLGYELSCSCYPDDPFYSTQFFIKPKILIVKGIINLPDNVLYDIQTVSAPIKIIKTSKYTALDPQNINLIADYCKENGFNYGYLQSDTNEKQQVF